MRSFVLVTAFAGFHLGGGMHFDAKFMRPHDPVMQEVAGILEGILSNLTKHKGYLQLDKSLQKRVAALAPKDHARLVGLLSEQITKLAKGGESFALDAFEAEHPDVKGARTDFKSALVSIVGDLKKIDPQGAAPSLRELLADLKVSAEGKAVLFVDDAEACGHYSKAAEAVAKQHDVVVVDASNITAPGLVDRVPEMYFVPADKAELPRRFEGTFDETAVTKFVADHSAGAPDARKALVHTGAVHSKAAAAEVTAITEAKLTTLMGEKGEDLFLVFFAPWCGHCKHFVVATDSPLNQLGQEVDAAGGKGKIQVLKMDVSSQPALPSQFGQVQFIPAIFFVPADRSKAVAHSGAQDIPALLAFIDSHAQSAKGLLA